MMNKTRIVLFCLCLLFTTSFGDESKSDNTNNSEEINGDQNSKQTKCQENDEKDCDIDYINSNETGPLDSHEAMNTRELKARNKRSTEVDKKAFRNMLLGLVHKKSQDMKVEMQDTDTGSQKFQSDASELLLELMVRIAAHPQQWDEVHELLQKIDTDILTSKKILSNLHSTVEPITEKPSTTQTSPTTTEIDKVQKLIILLDNEEDEYLKKKNKSSSNNNNNNNNNSYNDDWPLLGDDILNNSSENQDEMYNNNSKERTTTQTMYSWSNKPPIKNSSREFEFSYRRVTGLPLPYRSNYDKTRSRNAYIAVSVIAPKSRDVRLEKQNNLLEDELRQLKPWSHEENLTKMENIRKKWFIRSESNVNNVVDHDNDDDKNQSNDHIAMP